MQAINNIIDFIKKHYLYLKLFLWWNVCLRKDEMSYKLDMFYMKKRFKKTSISAVSILITYRRMLAHDLDAGESIYEIPLFKIRRARI